MATTTTRLDIVAEFADGQTYSFNVPNPRSDLEESDITDLSARMVTDQPLKIWNDDQQELANFVRISSATITSTTKVPVYEADAGLWQRDQQANAWKDNY